MSNSESPQIFMVRVYQAVVFDKKSTGTFYTNGRNGNASVEINVLADQLMVEFKSPTDCVWVPYTNISAIHINSNLRKENAIESAKDLETRKAIKHKPFNKRR